MAVNLINGDDTTIERINDEIKINLSSNKNTQLNTIETNITNLQTNQGTLSNLETIDKTSLVNAINEINGKNIFSTNEQIIGTWIDNKPIYRKVISTNSPSTTNTWVTLGSISNLSSLINIYGTLFGTNDGRILSINNPEPSYEIITTFINNNIQMKVTSSLFVSKQCHIILEYTKTTD